MWRKEDRGVFTVKSVYRLLEDFLCVEGTLNCLKGFWFNLEEFSTSKVVAFSWKLLHDLIPTKDNLVRRNCVPLMVNIINCVICGSEAETVNHLFFIVK